MVSKERFYQLDLLRFIAAVGVVFFHYTFRGYAADNLSTLSFPILGMIFKYGYLGVDFFFMISGFVILMTALNRDIFGFTVSRIARLYPAFWAGVTLTSIVALLIGGDNERYNIQLIQYIANLTMVSGYFGIKQVDSVYWTLLVEIRFYFLIFLVLFFHKMHRIQEILSVWLLLTIIFTFVHAPSFVTFFLFPEWASYFIAGAMFYLVKINGVNPSRIIVIFLAYLLSLMYAYEYTIPLEKHFSMDFSEEIIIIIITLFYYIFYLISVGRLSFFNKKNMIFLGVFTYPLYLIHQNVGFMIFSRLETLLNKYVLLITTIIIVLIFSYLIHRIVERRVSTAIKNTMNIALVYISSIKQRG